VGKTEEAERTDEDRLEDLQVIKASDLDQANAFHAFRFKGLSA
jgi:hypothetical protein